jgi:hypothetical protein
MGSLEVVTCTLFEKVDFVVFSNGSFIVGIEVEVDSFLYFFGL